MGIQKLLYLLLLSGSLVACAPGVSQLSSQIAEDVAQGASCEDFAGRVTKTLAQALIDAEELPSADEIDKALKLQLGDDEKNVKLRKEVLALYDTLTRETSDSLKTQNKDELLAAVVALEIGDETTPERAALKSKLKGSYQSVKQSAVEAGLGCAEVTQEVAEVETPDEPSVMATVALPVKGANRAMATAYQSCQALRIPSMNASSPSIASGGIVITGTHSNGVGKKRVYGDIKKLVASHYYIREGIEKDASCFDVTKKPLIYDYGGKPYATTKADSTLDFFTNAGSGTTALGVDCSGYIFASLASTGLRLAPGKKLSAYQVFGVSASMYMNPSSNGLGCFGPVGSTKTGTLKDGDILASSGHIVMIDKVGDDPFGTDRLKSIGECKTANVSYKNFDFDVLQSAPVKGAVGIDRMRASVYLAESSSMRTALIEYAVADCKARFGSASTIKPSAARLVRHSQSTSCKDTPVKLARQACVASCTQ